MPRVIINKHGAVKARVCALMLGDEMILEGFNNANGHQSVARKFGIRLRIFCHQARGTTPRAQRTYTVTRTA
jgi:hypothetical protein